MLRIISTFIFLFFTSTNLFADQLLNCDGCSTAQKRRPLFVQDIKRRVKNVFSAVTNVKVSADKAIVINALAQLSDEVNSQKDERLTDYDAAEKTISAQSIAECSNSAALYDFIATPSLRAAWYQMLISDNPVYYAVINNWNSAVSLIYVGISNGATEVSQFNKLTQAQWDDGGLVKVVKRPLAPTFDIVKGTALDCHGNNIPTTLEELPGFYLFGSANEFQDFQKYTVDRWGWDVAFLNPDHQFKDSLIHTLCRTTPLHKYECTSHSPPGQY